MIINTEKLKVTSTKFNKLLDSYYDNSNNIYNVYSNINNCYRDNDIKKFMGSVQVSKIYNDRYILELRNILDYYNKVIKLYSSFGKIIYIELDKLPNVINKLTDCKEIIYKIVVRLQSINPNLTPELSPVIKLMDDKCKIILNTLNELINDIRVAYKKISENEDMLHIDLIKINIKEIKDDII